MALEEAHHGTEAASGPTTHVVMRGACCKVPSMPLFRLIGDSSLYTKSGKNVKRIGPQLQEQLGTTDLWYCAVANAGVREILQMLKVKDAWHELMDLVEEKAQRVVFVVGGSYRKYAKHAKRYGLAPGYDENLARVRTWLGRRHFVVHDFEKQLYRWKLNGDGIHWDVTMAEAVGIGEMKTAGGAETTVPRKGPDATVNMVFANDGTEEFDAGWDYYENNRWADDGSSFAEPAFADNIRRALWAT
ncbi:hypothetical protein AK812_SmicGene27834 [Symbiodinium microadriaticum]|uniref:Uncharacterized protein n=1 Tax=Symbiodinium microadriaticum TaxID=2951 RepID=A0A1Q9D650_SYMMI|nr:hypothetical protein AK812_SmicGene27834 [Symbiodinium microadriaticum]